MPGVIWKDEMYVLGVAGWGRVLEVEQLGVPHA